MEHINFHFLLYQMLQFSILYNRGHVLSFNKIAHTHCLIVHVLDIMFFRIFTHALILIFSGMKQQLTSTRRSTSICKLSIALLQTGTPFLLNGRNKLRQSFNNMPLILFASYCIPIWHFSYYTIASTILHFFQTEKTCAQHCCTYNLLTSRCIIEFEIRFGEMLNSHCSILYA